MTKQELEVKLSDFISYYVSSQHEYKEESCRIIESQLFSLLNHYDDKLSLRDNIINKLKRIKSRNYFYNSKALFVEFLSFIKADCDISDIRYESKYILSFAQLNEKIKIAERDRVWEQYDNASKNNNNFMKNKFVMAKIFIYLTWIGLNREMIAEMQRDDYNKDSRIITVCNKQFDLDNILYQEDNQADIIDKELSLNIASKHMTNIDGFIDYDARWIEQNKGKTFKFTGKLLKCYCNNIIRTSRGSSKYLNTKVAYVATACIHDVGLVYKSGIMYRLYLTEKIYNMPIDQKSLPKILEDLNCSHLNVNHLLTEYNEEYKKLKHFEL